MLVLVCEYVTGGVWHEGMFMCVCWDGKMLLLCLRVCVCVCVCVCDVGLGNQASSSIYR